MRFPVTFLAAQGAIVAAAVLPSKYTLPQYSLDKTVRAATLSLTRAGFTYGPAVAGGPYYPSGAIGAVTAAADFTSIQIELTQEEVLTTEDVASATAHIQKYNGLKTLDDYTLLYDGEWTHSMPKGPVPGVLTNYTQDLLFSMERLSISPYAVRRLDPRTDTLAFDVDSSLAIKITGMTLTQLLNEGRLFYANYSDQATLSRTERYAAACDAYFFIDKASGDFLPLAIRTGVGANLIYTPADNDADWLLAKIMLNVNDFWFAQWNHLANTHEVVQIAWMAAIRTLSTDHPIYGLLNRLTYQVFGVQPLAAGVLFIKGGAVDQVFAYTGQAAQDYTTNRYNTGSGAFQANYFLTNLRSRGLIDCTFGPKLSHFPFFEDASVIHKELRKFMTDFVTSYYTSDAAVQADTELQAWISEANGAAKVIDFPSAPVSRTDTVIDILTHFAHLVSTSHHAVNTNELLSVSSTLPFHPPALFKPIPTSKGNTSVVSFLPPYANVATQLGFASLFSRPLLADSNRTLAYMFDDPSMLARMNDPTRKAAGAFRAAMQAFSDKIRARKFDADGLSQGMPFLWQALDPKTAPYSLTI